MNFTALMNFAAKYGDIVDESAIAEYGGEDSEAEAETASAESASAESASAERDKRSASAESEESVSSESEESSSAEHEESASDENEYLSVAEKDTTFFTVFWLKVIWNICCESIV